MSRYRIFQFCAVLVLIGLAAPLACNSSSTAESTDSANLASSKAPATTTSSRCFADKKLGIALTWLAGWHAEKSQDYELFLVPDEKSARGEVSVSLDVPDLPPHIPGFIPLNMVKNGYIDDLKKKEGNLKVAEDSVQHVTGAKADRVRSSWTEKGTGWSETALLMVHGDRVYIIRETSDDAHSAMAKAQFDKVVDSIQWIK